MHALTSQLPPSASPMTLFTPTTKTSARALNGATTSKAAATTGVGLDGTTTGTTFLSLLVDELQNQDPTSPMDSTAMVGQMISLNSLDQLVSINSELGSSPAVATSHAISAASPGSAADSQATNASSQSSSALLAAKNALLNSSSLSSSVNAASLAASNPSTTLDLSSFTNQFGGK